MDKLIYKAYLYGVSDVYSKHCIVNLDYLKEVENNLLNSNQYLPVLIRRHLTVDYLYYLKQNNSSDSKLIDKIILTRNLPNKEMVSEFKEWINQNKQYGNLFNKQSYDNLQKELMEIKKEYDGLVLW